MTKGRSGHLPGFSFWVIIDDRSLSIFGQKMRESQNEEIIESVYQE